MKWYYYLHENGDLIGKNPVAYNEADFDESPFVKHHWLIETTDRGDAWRLVLEALALGANIERIKELVKKWNLTYEDSVEMFKHTDLKTVSEEMKSGLDIFIEKFLNMKPDDYWVKIKERFDVART